MKQQRKTFWLLLLTIVLISATGLSTVAAADQLATVDDFENGLPMGTDADGNQIGFLTFNDPSSTVAISTTDAPPAPVPGSAAGNTVFQVDSNVIGGSGYAGSVHAFENASVDTWVPQDWSGYEGISFWLYGNNSGSTLFLDVLDNRVPGSTTDTAERWSVDIIDNFSGWQFIEIPFANFHRKEVGNGAPNDGFERFEVHGWAFGIFASGQPMTNYIDDVGLYGVAAVPPLAVSYQLNSFNIEEGTTGQITVRLNRPIGADDPAQVSVDYFTEPGQAIPGRDYVEPAAGTITFVQGGPLQQSFALQTLDDNKYEGTERILLRLSDYVDVEPGAVRVAAAAITDNDAYDDALVDDFERGAYLWQASPNMNLSTSEVAAGDPLAVPGQGAYETVLQLSAPMVGPSPRQMMADTSSALSALLPIQNRKIEFHIEEAIDRINQTTDDFFWPGGDGFYPEDHYGKYIFLHHQIAVQSLLQVIKKQSPQADAAHEAIDQLLAADQKLAELTIQRAHLSDGKANKIRNAEKALARALDSLEAGKYAKAIQQFRDAWKLATESVNRAPLPGATAVHTFAAGTDWSFADGLKFYYYGQGSGEPVTVELLDNRAPDPGPGDWSLVWSDEFNDPAGTSPDSATWSYEIGDGTLNGIPGWGNDERQYYTNNPENVSTDGDGNLVIRVQAADGSLECYYGPCEYTSARLISSYKAEFAYGRIESRIRVPDGAAGLWPAFWSLGTDIDRVGWPQTGEIDIMEYVSRIPTEIFGTIHGPGYSGGQSFGDSYDFGQPVSDDYHTFTIEWEPDVIKWYVDGILYHTAEPADVATNEWVFNDPVFLLLNVAVGGNFGGAISPNLTMPQETLVDYVRVYQGPDTAERFEANFVDDFTGWQEVYVPFTDFTRSSEQPAGAPDDGLGLTEVWGYGLQVPGNYGTAYLDQVRLVLPTHVTVTNANDSGVGSLRAAVARVADGGTVDFDPALANSTIPLTSGPLVVGKEVSIDGATAPGITLSGGGVDRIFIIDPTGDVTVSHLTVADGFGWQLAGGILNNGALTLDHVTVTNNSTATDAGDFWQGGGGIYNGENATLNLVDSTVSHNVSGWTGGGIYSYFNTTTHIIRSTISDNLSLDVAGGMRILGSGRIVNSTLSNNTSTTWHGGALFLTDGVMNIINSTVVNNHAPGGTTGGLFVGTFGPSSATLTIQNSIVANNGDFGCFLAPFGAGAVALISDGNNVATDGACSPVASDQIVGDAGIGPLADNGGPTLTHALLVGSAAIDAANSAACPATDQRGAGRDAACDVGAYEFGATP